MRLDVIIPTYNRQELLKRALASLLAAEVPAGLEVRVTVVDNNSRDETREVVAGMRAQFGGRLGYQFEPRQGRSPALNAGIRSTDGDLVGMIDDDEEVDGGWYARIASAFAAGGVDFIGGPYRPRWGAEPPAWLPPSHRGAVGWVDGGEEVRVYGEDYPGVLMGGNAVLTRSVLRRVGLYSNALGRTAGRLTSCEDEEMQRRLLASGARGLYLPDLVVYHYIPAGRLTKRYLRRWCLWHGASRGLLDREYRLPVAYLGGVPRYIYGRALRGLLALAGGPFRRGPDPAATFAHELALWSLAGFFYGKHFFRQEP